MRKLQYGLLLMFVLNISDAFAQDDKFKALFMYNFTKYLEWPSSQKQGNFVIEVLGNSPMIDELKIIAQKRKVGAQSIQVIKIASISESRGGNILFIPEYKSSSVREAVTKFRNNGTIIITDKPGLISQGAGINYVKVNGKQNFEVSKTNIEQLGLKVNSVLLSLGIAVD